MKKEAGILMHISSLPSKYGIGTLGEEAYKFVDFLKESGQKYWQVLPVGPTSYGDSPYQSFSSFAGNPYFIDLDILIDEGLLTQKDVSQFKWGINNEEVDYGVLYENRFKVLKRAYQNRTDEVKKEVKIFEVENAKWLFDYSLFMSIKNFYGGLEWIGWPKSIRLRTKKAMTDYTSLMQEEINFWGFVQYLFYKQWTALKKYANKNEIKIIGDLPIYCAFDSADVWAEKKLFKLNREGIPTVVSGCPPDAFSENGQLWGNPIYDWNYLKKSNYQYWINRVEGSIKLYDYVRIDHFRGFESFWQVKFGSENAIKGTWVKGPGIELFDAIKLNLGDVNIIAENLGYLTEAVFDLLEETGFPGMNVLQFAFDGDKDNKYLPENQKDNSIVYTGTHDNKTTITWAEEDLTIENEKEVRKLSNLSNEEPINKVLIDIAYSSPAKLAIIPIQDVLGIGKEGRINEPSTLGKNWTWRLGKDELTEDVKKELLDMIKVSRR